MVQGRKKAGWQVMAVLAGSMVLMGCGEAPAPSGKVGADEDVHGCKGSAGYTWCEKTNQCERPWELAEKEKFENTETAFNAYCSVKNN